MLKLLFDHRFEKWTLAESSYHKYKVYSCWMFSDCLFYKFLDFKCDLVKQFSEEGLHNLWR